MNLSSTAQAQTAGGSASPAPGFDPMSLLPFVLIIVIFYFLIFRPQQKRMKQQREMLAGLHRGDKVVTSGGIWGTITRIENDQEVYVEIAPDVVIRLNRSSIADVLSKPAVQEGKPASSDSNDQEASSQPAASSGHNKKVEDKTEKKTPARKTRKQP